MKFYILVHRKLEYLQKHAETIPLKDQVVVINSLDNDFVDQASLYCQENSIEYYVTESDGTPAKGKNSVLKLFLESENNYMVQVDGDDHITPYGYLFYTKVARHASHGILENPPDIICLKNQFALRALAWKKDQNGNEKCTQYERLCPWHRSREGQAELMSPSKHYYDLTRKAHWIKNPWPEEMEDTLKEWAQTRAEFERFWWEFGNGSYQQREIFTRMVFYSRKAVELMQFDEDLIIGEDAIEFLRLKHLAKKGVINMVTHNEMPMDKKRPGKKWDYSYLYQQLDFDSVVTSRSYDPEKDRTNYEWMMPIIDYIHNNDLEKKYESIKGWHLPEFKRFDQ